MGEAADNLQEYFRTMYKKVSNFVSAKRVKCTTLAICQISNFVQMYLNNFDSKARGQTTMAKRVIADLLLCFLFND